MTSQDNDRREAGLDTQLSLWEGSKALLDLLHSGEGLGALFARDIGLGEQKIVGVRFRGGARDLVEDLVPGSQVVFLREPDNVYDPLAIVALDEQGRKLGYIPRSDNRILSALMDAGKVLYGIVPEDPGHSEAVITVDLFMRETAGAGDRTTIPLTGSCGSYAVTDLAMTKEGKMRSLFAIKVINGEERGIFSQKVASAPEEEREERRRAILRDYYDFIGLLPVVGHAIDGAPRQYLEEMYGLLLGLPFSNLVIDTRIMAENSLPEERQFGLRHLASSLRIPQEGTSAPERRCRAVWALYRRLDDSKPRGRDLAAAEGTRQG